MTLPPTQVACQSCGAPLEAHALFCPQCGASRQVVPPRADPLIGRVVIGQYVIRQRLGEGGMGAVYLADQPTVGRQAVVKVMHPTLSLDPAVAPRFEVEARAASQLNHPHIITIYNYGAMEDGTLFLAMEYVGGVSLEQELRQGPLEPARAATIGAQICDALGEAHRRGVVHRDLKPPNIMLMPLGRQRDFVKVLDFGIAKVEGLKMTRTGSFLGTPQYMSPEQLKGAPLDGRADLYALGAMLYEMVAGELPFRADTVAGYMHAHLNEEPMAPGRRNPTLRIPAALEAVILRALAKDPAARFQDADEMGRLLEACGPGAVVPPTIQGPAARPARGPRTLWLAAAASAAVAAIAAVALVVLLRDDGRGADPAGTRPGAATWRTLPADEPPRGASARSAEPRPAARPAEPQPAARSAEPRPIARVAEAVVDAGAGGGTSEAAEADPGRTRSRRGRPRRVLEGAHAARSRSGNEAQGEVASVAPAAALPALASDASKGGPYQGLSGNELEALFRRIAGNAKVPPSTIEKTFEGYRNAMSSWPPAQRETLRRNFLVQLIEAYRRPSLQWQPAERKALPELQRIFLTMRMKTELSPEQRQQILKSALGTYDQGDYSPDDRGFYKRMALVQMIKNMAADPGQALRP